MRTGGCIRRQSLIHRVAEGLVAEVVGVVPEETSAVRSNHELFPQMVLGDHPEALDCQVVRPEAGLADTAGQVGVMVVKQGLVANRPPVLSRMEPVIGVDTGDHEGLAGTAPVAAPVPQDDAQMPRGIRMLHVPLDDRVRGAAHPGCVVRREWTFDGFILDFPAMVRPI